MIKKILSVVGILLYSAAILFIGYGMFMTQTCYSLGCLFTYAFILFFFFLGIPVLWFFGFLLKQNIPSDWIVLKTVLTCSQWSLITVYCVYSLIVVIELY